MINVITHFFGIGALGRFNSGLINFFKLPNKKISCSVVQDINVRPM